jgi:hypothetical protein
MTSSPYLLKQRSKAHSILQSTQMALKNAQKKWEDANTLGQKALQKGMNAQLQLWQLRNPASAADLLATVCDSNHSKRAYSLYMEACAGFSQAAAIVEQMATLLTWTQERTSVLKDDIMELSPDEREHPEVLALLSHLDVLLSQIEGSLDVKRRIVEHLPSQTNDKEASLLISAWIYQVEFDTSLWILPESTPLPEMMGSNPNSPYRSPLRVFSPQEQQKYSRG